MWCVMFVQPGYSELDSEGLGKGPREAVKKASMAALTRGALHGDLPGTVGGHSTRVLKSSQAS